MCESLVEKYGVDMATLHTLNMQRIGLCTDVEPNAARLDVKFLYGGKAYRIPFAKNSESPYKIQDGRISLGDSGLSFDVISMEGDLAWRPYYTRGEKILVVNSTFLSPCGQKCLFCEETMAPTGNRRYSLKFSADELFNKVMDEQNLPDLGCFSQISVVTSCAGTEARAEELVLGYKEEAERKMFKGKILFPTNEIRSEESIRRLAEVGRIILAFTVECFENRSLFMPGSKGSISLERIKGILALSKRFGMESTYFYIFGLDDIGVMDAGFTFLKDAINIAPTGPIYQPQWWIDNIGIRPLEYFLKARETYKRVHRGLEQFESCQSFRSIDPLAIRLSRTTIGGSNNP